MRNTLRARRRGLQSTQPSVPATYTNDSLPSKAVPMDPSQDLDTSTFDSATGVGAGVYKNKETMLWRNSSAYYKKPEDKSWTKMRDTGQWTLQEGWSAYLSGGEIRKKT
uniref:Uncharacterized protein n=1 Tax=Photinus pyralis TaxID=7054 RepID=A0A1Y1KC52_PHOPY